ncbi:MAG TPA: Rrf2 family transcriptional regulator [Armatimonadota bacterium]|nr:Rrf2 family transcriptional regulator [Armatimonadota bacterium]
MVRLSAKTEYALRAMMDLAMHPTVRTTLPAIAERQGIPRKFLPTVLHSLIQAELVHSIRGYGGGVELSGDPAKITIRQIIESVEGPQQLYDCDFRGNDCIHQNDCKLRNVLERAGDAMLGVLGEATLADLVPATECANCEKELVSTENN